MIVVGTLLGATTAYAQKVGVNDRNPTEVLDVNGTLRVRELPQNNQVNAHSTSASGAASAAKDQTFKASGELVVDKNGVVGQAPRYFYMPSLTLPTDPTVPGRFGDSDASGLFTVDLYDWYAKMQGMTQANTAKSVGATTLPVEQKEDLEWFVIYYDADMFTDVAVSNEGKLTYRVLPGGTVSENTFMNVVVKIK